jgi:hypothetical protein
MFELSGMAEFPGWKISEGIYITATLELIQGTAVTLMQHYAPPFQSKPPKPKNSAP